MLSKNAEITPLYLKSLKDILDKDAIGSNGKPLQSAPSFSYAEELGAIRSNPHQFQTISLSAHRSASNNAQVLAGEVVISFTLHSGSQRSQDIDMLGSQTLRDLRDAICHGLKEKCEYETEGDMKSRSDSFFLIEGYFYADDTPSPSKQPHTSGSQSRAKCGGADSLGRLHNIRKWLIHGNQDGTVGSQNAALATEECSVDNEDEDVEEEEEMIEGTVETSLASNQRLELTARKKKNKKLAAAPAASASVPAASASASASVSKRRKIGRHDPPPAVSKAIINQNTISSKRVKKKALATSTVRKSVISRRVSSVSFVDSDSDSNDSRSDCDKQCNTSDKQTDRRTTNRRGLINRRIEPTSAGGSAALESHSLNALCPNDTTLQKGTGNIVVSGSGSRSGCSSGSGSGSASASGIGSGSESRNGSGSSTKDSNSRCDKRESLLELNGLPASSTLTILSIDTNIASLLLRSGVRYLYNQSGGTSGDREYFLYVTDMHLHSSNRGSTNNPDSANSGMSTSKDKPASYRDLPLISSYPRQTFQVRTVVKKCAVCLLWSAQYVVYGDRLADRSPMLYCQYVT